MVAVAIGAVAVGAADDAALAAEDVDAASRCKATEQALTALRAFVAKPGTLIHV